MDDATVSTFTTKNSLIRTRELPIVDGVSHTFRIGSETAQNYPKFHASVDCESLAGFDPLYLVLVLQDNADRPQHAPYMSESEIHFNPLYKRLIPSKSSSGLVFMRNGSVLPHTIYVELAAKWTSLGRLIDTTDQYNGLINSAQVKHCS